MTDFPTPVYPVKKVGFWVVIRYSITVEYLVVSVVGTSNWK